ncbi:MAG: cytochrome c, partial [candidate division Zixibacteria bacterium]|nr:cytochrome c [candidate division Zixibacteria bacterium]
PLARAMAADGGRRFVAMSMATDTNVYVAVAEPERVVTGGETFRRVCASCHGMEGGGGVGPNLTDDYWLHGSDMTAVTKTIKYGWPSKGMQAWRGLLKEDEILEVASFVMTLKGTNVSGGIAPQGELVTQ